MKKKYLIPAILVVLMQVALGAFLVFTSFYMDENYYLEIDGFFMHFMHVPGGTMVILALHYILYPKYEKKISFVLTGLACAFIICNTGECIFLLQEMFPNGWIKNVLWFILADAVTSVLIMFFHALFNYFMSKNTFEDEDEQ